MKLSYNKLSGLIPQPEICNQGDSEPELEYNNLCPPYPGCLDYVGEQNCFDCPSEAGSGDVDGDGSVNVLDVVLLVNLILDQ